MSTEVVRTERRFRSEIPEAWKSSLDTRIMWLWNQRAGTAQMIWKNSPDTLDVTAATMMMQAMMAEDLNAIALLFRRLEGGAVGDEILADQEIVF